MGEIDLFAHLIELEVQKYLHSYPYWAEHPNQQLIYSICVPVQLLMTVCDRSYSYLTTGEEGNSHEVDQMLLTLATALKNIFPSVPLT